MMGLLPVLLLTLTSVAPQFVMAQSSDQLQDLRSRALELVNEARAEDGLSRLEADETLKTAAQAHADAMLDENFYAHVTPGGETPRDRFIDAGGERWAVSGENIARCSGCPGPADTERVVAFHEGWMQSPEHRENILSPGFDKFGFGLSAGDGQIFAVQTFSGPGSAANGASATTLTPERAREIAVEEVNTARTSRDLSPLEPSSDLDHVAEHVLELRLDGKDLPEDVFGLLPEGSSSWTSLAMQSLSRGGSGTTLAEGNLRKILEQWTRSQEGETFGGGRATHFGFSTSVQETGRMLAVAVFGGRG